MKEQCQSEPGVYQLAEVATSQNISLISELERLLIEAKSGELLGMAWVCQWRGDQVSSSWSLSQMHARKLIGEIEFLKRDLMESAN